MRPNKSKRNDGVYKCQTFGTTHEPACREKDKDALAWAYHDYGYTLLAQNDLGEAKLYLKKAMDCPRQGITILLYEG